MTRKIVLLMFLFVGFCVNAQITSKEFRSKIFVLVKDSIQIDSASINSQKFKVLDSNNKEIDNANYQMDFINALLIINSKKYKFLKKFSNFRTRFWLLEIAGFH